MHVFSSKDSNFCELEVDPSRELGCLVFGFGFFFFPLPLVYLQLFYTQCHCQPCTGTHGLSLERAPHHPDPISAHGHLALGMTKGRFRISGVRYLRFELICHLLAFVINLWGGILYFMGLPRGLCNCCLCPAGK